MLGFADINQTRVHYEAAGSGPAVILLHGHFLDLRMWDRQFKALSTSHRVVRPDLRGHGRTEMPVLPYSHPQDLFALMRFLGLEAACLVGHSLGAAVAVEFALKFPARVTGLVLASPYLRGHSASAAHAQRLDRYTGVARQHGAARARRVWLEKDELLAPARARREVFARMAEIVRAFQFTEALRPALEHAPETTALHRLSDIQAPALIVVGERDALDIRAAAKALHAGIPDARTTVIPESGHWPNVEQPEAFNWCLLNFLQTTRSAP